MNINGMNAELKRLAADKAALEDRVRGLVEAADALPDGPWEVWNSCSFRRISGPDGRDGGVLCGTAQRSDGHPDLSMNDAQLRALCDIVNGVRAILAAMQPAEGEQG